MLAAALLTVFGAHDAVYAVLLPPAIIVTAVAGRIVGPAAGQAGFTVVVAVLFAQLSPAAWTLAGVRVLDVAIGAVIGVVVGAVIWPRGAHAEVRRDAAASLEASADLVTATSSWALGTATRWEVEDRLRDTVHRLVQLESSYAQFRTERAPAGRRADDPDWPTVLGTVHRCARGARTALEGLPPSPASPPWPEVEHRLRAEVEHLAEGYRSVAARLRRAPEPGPEPLVVTPPRIEEGLRALAETPGRRTDPERSVRMADAWGWLGWLGDDLATLTRLVSG